ncbi:MAG: hypothetical protein HYX69_10275 [Planctomycetia bacterium]|nr:hypothetical protein [Planctomycetia bacterium]
MEELLEIFAELLSWSMTKLIFAFKGHGKPPSHANDANHPAAMPASSHQPPPLSRGARIVLRIIFVLLVAGLAAVVWRVGQ